MSRISRGPLAAAMLLLFLPLAAVGATSTPSDSPEATVVFTGERAIVRDAVTGALRKPTREEATELARTLKQLTNRSSEGLRTTTTSSGAEMLDLEDRFQMVVIARPTESGEMETLCVSTFDEAAEFLGLQVEKKQDEGRTRPVDPGKRSE